MGSEYEYGDTPEWLIQEIEKLFDEDLLEVRKMAIAEGYDDIVEYCDDEIADRNSQSMYRRKADGDTRELDAAFAREMIELIIVSRC